MAKNNEEVMIRAKGLTKVYGEFVAVDGIDFEVKKGEAFGLLGPNGAGKSTTMKMIASTSRRTGGELEILGKDPNEHGPEIRAHLGVVPQQDNLDRELKVWENLMTYGRYFGLSRKFLRGKIEELLEFAQLEDKRNNKTEELSGGMKRRLTIARGLVNEPEILMLDEPTTGLDPQARHLMWERLQRLVQHESKAQPLAIGVNGAPRITVAPVSRIATRSGSVRVPKCTRGTGRSDTAAKTAASLRGCARRRRRPGLFIETHPECCNSEHALSPKRHS